MSAICKKITLEMEENGQSWSAVIDTENADDIDIKTEFLPYTGQEMILLKIVRTTNQSREYSAYLKSMNPLRRPPNLPNETEETK